MVLIGVLLFLEHLFGAIVVITTTGEMPTPQQWITIFCVSMLQLITYLLTFLRTGQLPEEE